MPIILPIPPDPTDRIIPGEQMRASVADRSVPEIGSMIGMAVVTGFSSLVPDEDALAPMNSMIDGNLLSMRRSKNNELQMRDGAGICSPCGAWSWLDYTPLLSPLLWATERWAVAGVTKDSAGAALGSCRVVALETGRISQENVEASVGETISDGSGNYSIPVPMNTAYQLIAYKPGAPDVAGITRNDVVPAAVG